MAARITLKEVARQAGVSESAASFALNGRSGVSEATRQRVLQVADALEWRPNHASKVLSGASTSTIGLVIARGAREVGSESFFLRLMTGIQDELSPRNQGLLLQIVGSIAEEMSTYRTWATEHRVDGVLVVDLVNSDPRPEFLAELDLPAVLVGVADPHHARPAVTVDDDAAMHQIVRHLADTGHQHVAYLCGNDSAVHIGARVKAFRKAAAQFGMTQSTVTTGFSAAVASDAVTVAVRGPDRPDAFIFDNEVLALAGLHALMRANLQVPDDACIVVWEDSPVSQAIEPQLTALDRDPFTLGAHAARRLLDVIGGETDDVAEPRPSLIIRESSKCARVSRT